MSDDEEEYYRQPDNKTKYPTAPLTDVEQRVLTKLLGMCKLSKPPTEAPWGRIANPHDGRDFLDSRGHHILCSPTSREMLAGFIGQTTINGVPVEPRRGAKKIFKSAVERHEIGGKYSLLCTAGFSGSGKTVQQLANMFWFIQDVGGIAIEITFNDDQTNDPPNVDTFDEAVALRIFHRAMSFHLVDEEAKAHFSPETVELVRTLKDPIQSALRITRLLLGIPAGTPVMLGVDELRKAAGLYSRDPRHATAAVGITAREDQKDLREIQRKEAESFTLFLYMRNLMAFMDYENTYDLYLTITALGCADLERVANFGRVLLLQPLPPIFPMLLNDLEVHHLPLLLHVFANSETRMLLPFDKIEYKWAYSEISRLLVLSGGHPRRVEHLLRELEQFSYPGQQSKIATDNASGFKFAEALCSWLTTNRVKRVENEMDKAFLYPTRPDLIDWESLAQDAGCSFNFPRTDMDLAPHRSFMRGTERGYCHFLSSSRRNAMLGQAFIPLPVLSLLNANHLKPATAFVRARTLALLGDALRKFSQADDEQKEKKSLESLLAYALLLFAQSINTFHLLKLFMGAGSSLNERLRVSAGQSVFYWEIDCFLAKLSGNKMVAAVTVENIIDKMTEKDSEGVVFYPQDKYNIGMDIGMLLRIANELDQYVLLIIQCRDWFSNHCNGEHVFLPWRKNRKNAFVNAQFTTTNNQTYSNIMPAMLQRVGHKVKVFYVLCTCAPIEEQDMQNLEADECVMDLVSMRSWCPTAAYPAYAAHRFHALFKDLSQQME